MRSIAFFDFDGTITTKDSLLEFIKFSKGKTGFWIGFLLNSPYLLFYKLKIISNQKAKEKVLAYFFKGTSLSEFEKECTRFASEMLPSIIRPQALHEIEKLKSENTEIVIVSASPENWVSKWANHLQIDTIATRLEVIDEKLTGNIFNKNCHGEEKVKRITTKYSVADYKIIYAYGDSSGDKPMLSIATKPFYKPFRN